MLSCLLSFTHISIYEYYISFFGVRKCIVYELYNVLLHDTNFLYISICYLFHFDEIIVLSQSSIQNHLKFGICICHGIYQDRLTFGNTLLNPIGRWAFLSKAGYLFISLMRL